jgi:hypothetical protein
MCSGILEVIQNVTDCISFMLDYILNVQFSMYSKKEHNYM